MHGTILFAIACLFLTACTSSGGLPSEARRVLFEESRFADPILLRLPEHITQSQLAAELQRVSTPSFVPPLPMTGWVDPQDEYIRFLEQQGLVQLESLNYRCCGAKYFPTHTQKTTQHTAHYDGRFGEEGVGLNAAQRKLKEITFTNSFEDSMSGSGTVTIHALTFTYELEESIPEIPNLGKVFTGKARLFRDPADGEWKIISLELPDRGDIEYMELIENEVGELSSADLPNYQTQEVTDGSGLNLPAGQNELVNMRVHQVRFFEITQEIPAPHERSYAFRFDKARIKGVGVQLDLVYASPSRQLDIDIKSVLHTPGGDTSEASFTSYVEAGWSGSSHYGGSWSFDTPGRWSAGTYRVDILIDGEQVANEQFEIYQEPQSATSSSSPSPPQWSGSPATETAADGLPTGDYPVNASGSGSESSFLYGDYQGTVWINSVSIGEDYTQVYLNLSVHKAFEGLRFQDISCTGDRYTYLIDNLENRYIPSQCGGDIAGNPQLSAGEVYEGYIHFENRPPKGANRFVFYSWFNDPISFAIAEDEEESVSSGVHSQSDTLRIDESTPGYYNHSLGNLLDGTQPQFPAPEQENPTISNAAEPDLRPVSDVLGDWLSFNPLPLNSSWSDLQIIPST